MKIIEVEDDLYRYIAGQTEHIGESASAILRRLLGLQAVDTLATEDAAESTVADSTAAKTTVIQMVEAVPVETPQPVVTAPATSPVSSPANSPTSGPASFKQLLTDPQIPQQKAAVGRFLYLLAQLHQQDPATFGGVLEIRGRNRLYFADAESTLLASAASAKPKQISGSDFWVMTNSNTSKKRGMLLKVLSLMGCDTELAEEITELI